MNRLRVQLALAFALVTLFSVGLAAFLVSGWTSSDFRNYVARSQFQESDLARRLEQFYARTGSWAGVESVIGTGGRSQGQGRVQPQGRGMNLTLSNPDGLVIYPPDNPISQMDARTLEAAWPLVVDGETVGYLVQSSGGGMAMSTAAEQFLSDLRRALLQAGLIAGGLGLLLGLLIAGGLAAPLDRLARAARTLRAGSPHEPLPARGPREVAEASRAFNEMAAGLEEAEQLRRRMVADIAHELRTPLSVIQGNLRAMLDDVYPLSKTEITTVYDETLMLHRLVEDLRELTLAEAGQLTLHPQELDPVLLIRQSAGAFSELAAERGIKFQIDVPADLPAIRADADRVGQVIHNLLGNALRHTPSGGQVKVYARREGAMIRFAVCDSGPGIAAADLPQVFERFWRAERSRSREHGGSGLGLAIARELIETQGGRIGVASEVGVGSTFWFTLPVQCLT
jgi:two-component system OmpR family sensor kinase/two-component system sensor histidine kinase BaeS